MLVRVTDIRMPVEAPEENLVYEVAKRLGIKKADIANWRILRKSMDARSRQEIQYVYTAIAETKANSETFKKLKRDKKVDFFKPDRFDDVKPGSEAMDERPVIIGSGPAGLLAGYYLALKGYKPIILERGHPVKQRVPAIRSFDSGGEFERDNNYLYGEGGAGCFSDGKLTCRLTGPDVDWVLDAFVTCGGKESIRYEHRPHLGSNKLPMICRNFRRKIDALGGEYRFGCQVERLIVEDGKVTGLKTSTGDIKTSVVILAIGHSARDTYETLYEQGVPIVQKPFQLGLRIEQPQAQINHHKYGKDTYVDLLGAADYSVTVKLHTNNQDREMYSFCMCAGGYVIPSVSEYGEFCSNGMSNSRHDSIFANSGLMVTLYPHEFGSDHPLAGMYLQRKYEQAAYMIGMGEYKAPISWAGDFLKGKKSVSDIPLPSSYERGTIIANMDEILPPVVLKSLREGLPIMDKKYRGNLVKNGTVVGPEMRGSAPVRIDRDLQTRVAPGFEGLYPVGEGAGYAGGIVSAAVDGLRSAKAIVSRFAPVG
jgi:uncharacterized FAD-dependent dehydrogenase